ncbi:hypothetical protein Sjap_022670 [Stephania japonica]|uniref:Uncharacterized protein n=1 Tax=Stephania japonica TaxID=461633 RepID=A0AAP0EV04_9MAGN
MSKPFQNDKENEQTSHQRVENDEESPNLTSDRRKPQPPAPLRPHQSGGCLEDKLGKRKRERNERGRERKRILPNIYQNIIDSAIFTSIKMLDMYNEIEAAVWNADVCKRLLLKVARNDALEFVRVFVKEAMKEMGCSFLEQMAQKVNENDGLEVQLPSDMRLPIQLKGDMEVGIINSIKTLISLLEKIQIAMAQITYDACFHSTVQNLSNTNGAFTKVIIRIT